MELIIICKFKICYQLFRCFLISCWHILIILAQSLVVVILVVCTFINLKYFDWSLHVCFNWITRRRPFAWYFFQKPFCVYSILVLHHFLVLMIWAIYIRDMVVVKAICNSHTHHDHYDQIAAQETQSKTHCSHEQAMMHQSTSGWTKESFVRCERVPVPFVEDLSRTIFVHSHPLQPLLQIWVNNLNLVVNGVNFV